MSGKKRGSPGADEEKNPLEGVELGDEDAQKLKAIQKQIERVDLLIGTYFAYQPLKGTNVHRQSVTVSSSFCLCTRGDVQWSRQFPSFGLSHS